MILLFGSIGALVEESEAYKMQVTIHISRLGRLLQKVGAVVIFNGLERIRHKSAKRIDASWAGRGHVEKQCIA